MYLFILVVSIREERGRKQSSSTYFNWNDCKDTKKTFEMVKVLVTESDWNSEL